LLSSLCSVLDYLHNSTPHSSSPSPLSRTATLTPPPSRRGSGAHSCGRVAIATPTMSGRVHTNTHNVTVRSPCCPLASRLVELLRTRSISVLTMACVVCGWPLSS
jgi:hypothetical protein